MLRLLLTVSLALEGNALPILRTLRGQNMLTKLGQASKDEFLLPYELAAVSKVRLRWWERSCRGAVHLWKRLARALVV
jgi:hypothetical protein